MSRFLRSTAAVLTVASLALAVGCNQTADDAETADAAAEAGADTEGALTIPGLADEKEQASYMIGMEMAKSLEPLKEEIDLDTLHEAMTTALAGETPLMNEEQVAQVQQRFTQKMQAKQVAERLAQAEENAEQGAAFLAENAGKPNVETTESGLQYQVLTPAEGPTPDVSDTVSVHYKGSLLDGTTFDSSYDRGQPAEIPLAAVVPGWQEGIALMPVGSKYRFWIPGELGYGEQGTPGGPIGPNDTLVFEVELLDIVDAPAAQ
ncbi:FKBP-type peptidyl-prolyl cis-trans isomerase [Lysobacter sp. D1-1-M9]|uniref:FKBP-type peptidyl-prolyl cis-trans isomerase n=1 Tax=Novilysobacter longmucuonensis TaxID=3098603 RepID=UPI002FCB9F50